MRLESLFIKKYNIFHNQEILFNLQNNENLLLSEIFGDLKITLFVGENGSGKTTILSFISKIFSFLQRNRHKIPSDFELKYYIGIKSTEIIISKSEHDFFITIDGTKYFLQEFNIKNKSYIYDVRFENQVSYTDIIEYLPSNVIVLGFDTSYQMSYSWNYYGHRIVEEMNLNSCYKDNCFGLDLSSGLVTLIHHYLKNPKVSLLFNHMNFEFSNKVKVFVNFSDDDYDETFPNYIHSQYFTESFWSNYSLPDSTDNENDDKNYTGFNFDIFKFLNQNNTNYNILSFFIQNNFIYINDQYINKGGLDIPINNMSTGEKSFIFRLCYILSKINNSSLIIFEEPETHLNVMWAKQLVPLITLLFKDYDACFLFSSHELHFINCLFPEQILLLANSEIMRPNFQTFLANETEIRNNLFPKTFFNLFEANLLSLIDNKNNNLSPKYILEHIGESYLKFLIYKTYE